MKNALVHIRVSCVSPGPCPTKNASAIVITVEKELLAKRDELLDYHTMTATIQLDPEEAEELVRRTNQPDVESALKEVAHRFLNEDKHAGLMALAGKIEFAPDHLEKLDAVEIASARELNHE